MLYVFLALISGAMISLQSSYNGMLYPFIGVLGVGLVNQILNASTSLGMELATAKKFPKPNGMPLHACLGGICAVFVLGFSGYLASVLGSAVTVCLSVSGQLVMSAVVDHFGMFGSEKVRFRAFRIPGFLCILAGVFVINFVGGDSFTGVSGGRGILFLLLLFAVFVGCVTVFARLLCYEASHYVGKIAAGFYNGCSGALAALILLLILPGFRFSLSDIAHAPLIAYLAGPFGALTGLFNNLAYEKMKIFHATILLLIGQIAAGIAADFVLLGDFPMGKFLGILVVCAGIFLDKRLTMEKH